MQTCHEVSHPGGRSPRAKIFWPCPAGRCRWLVVAVVWGGWGILSAAAEPARGNAVAERNDPKADAVEFLRLSRDAKGRPVSLDTSIVHYRETEVSARAAGRRTPVEVDLVGARPSRRKGVLRHPRPPLRGLRRGPLRACRPRPRPCAAAGAEAISAIGNAQQGLTKMLGLTFQLDEIDYSAANFIHADMSPKEFDAAMQKRGESWWTMFTRLMREGAERAERGKPTGPEVGIGDLWGMFFGKDREVRLRRIMAEQFTDMEVLTAAFGGEEGSTLITDRNGAALEVLSEQIAAGKERIAIFYAAHEGLRSAAPGGSLSGARRGGVGRGLGSADAGGEVKAQTPATGPL